MFTDMPLGPILEAFLERHADHAAAGPPVAVFDCDGTVIRGDIGEAMFYRQIDTWFFRTSPGEVWPDCPFRDDISRLFRALAAAVPQERARMPEFEPFADMLLTWYFGQIDEGRVAKACSDIVRLLGGFTEAEVRAFAEATFLEEHASPLTTRTLGGRRLPRGVRYIREAVDILTVLRRAGFEIWAVSGSNRWSVEPVFSRLDVPVGRVIGIDLDLDGDRLTHRARHPIPVRDGKVDALRQHTDRPPVLVASDSRNDIPLFLISTDLKVRINSRRRDTDEFFRAGNITPDDSWLVIEEPTLIS